MLNKPNIDRLHILVVTPVFNEAEVIAEFTSKISQVRDQIQSECDLRILFVNDGSRDSSHDKINLLCSQYNWIGFRRLTGNFGHQAALIAGLSAVDEWADLAVTMDSDLEHPPEAIIEMLTRWKAKKCNVVRGIRQTSEKLPLQKRIFSNLFYRITARVTGLKLLNGQTDFCLWDAKVILELKPYLHSIGSLRVFSSWLPGEKEEVYFQQGFRKSGLSRYTFEQNWNLTLNAILRFSSKPLRLISGLGLLGITVSAIHGIGIVYAIATNEPLQPGWTTLIFSVIFMGCLQLICLGILSSYLRRLVFSKDLPLFLVKEDKLF